MVVGGCWWLLVVVVVVGSFFFSLYRHNFHSFSLSLGVFSWLFFSLSGSYRGILVVFLKAGTSNMLVFALRLSCETLAAGFKTAGASHNSPRTPNVHI